MAIQGYTTNDLPKVTGVSLGRILWAYRSGKLPEVPRLGCHRVHTEDDVRRIRDYFRGIDEERQAASGRKAVVSDRRSGKESGAA